MPVKAVKAESSDAGHSWATIRRASTALNTESYREGEKGLRDGGMWLWRIPRELDAHGGVSTLKTGRARILIRVRIHAGFRPVLGWPNH